jgi:c-di-GMP-binding flagellar brake protein YcgR
MDKKNRRTEVRVNRRLIVTYNPAGVFLRSGSGTKTISEGGICIPMERPFPVDTLLEVEINSEDIKGPIRVVARIVWVEKRDNVQCPFEAGLQFTEISQIQREKLREFVKKFHVQGENDVRWLE